MLHSTSTCVNAVSADENYIASQLPARLDSALQAIRSHAPGAKIVLLGYPELYDLSKSSTCIGLSTTDRTKLDEASDTIDSVISAAAGRAGDTFADVRGQFAGHEICDGSSSWLHSVNIFDISESYHPTANGQELGYEPVFAAKAG